MNIKGVKVRNVLTTHPKEVKMCEQYNTLMCDNTISKSHMHELANIVIVIVIVIAHLYSALGKH